MLQVLQRLECLHSKDYLYRDMKPSNFMIAEDKRTIYIIDFGLCKKYLKPNSTVHIPERQNKKMVGMLQSMYGETAMPMVMPEHKAMNDSLSTKTGAEYDRTFYRNLITHHREAIKMVNDMMPRMTKADIKQMAEKMKADQQKEITAFERKVK